MIRFVDVSAAYFGCDEGEPAPMPICAFVSTVSDRFVEDADGEHLFHGMDEVLEIPEEGERCARLVPDGFFGRPGTTCR